MISVGILILAGGAYLAGWYGLAFWTIAIAIANGTLATAWAIINPDWYWEKRRAAGDEAILLAKAEGYRSFVPELLLAKGILIAVMAVAAWHVGRLAGYF